MTDPLGKHWEQPSREEILVDDYHAVMTKKSFDQLKDYSQSQPTGVYEGKMWRRQQYKEVTLREVARHVATGKWLLCWYGEHPNPGVVSNNYREILIID
jgi:hypothetical protein